MDGITFDEPPVLRALILGRTSYAAFTEAIEWSHGGPHSAIGGAQLTTNEGDMSFVPTSPNDPAFYLHHAFIDYLWARRQAAPGRSANEYGGTNRGGRPARSSDRLSPFGRATVASTFSLPCVTYAEPRATTSPRRPVQRRSRLAALRVGAVVDARRVRREAAQAAFARSSGLGAAAVARARRTVVAASDGAVAAGTLD
ncbi:hypothetical protein BU14_0259s0022 [Porphyra umbilicalis]|uniref:Tyrosinase copper-binding domain-containing protein n=1 Tax=Porphyra umbilicalis TaxID=2786 RepID=A0A1X6P2D6_PORUM|nr:hypothetical protein BU14_0259s0022 [Porphyra umbilicalis]|eukprot:OSX74987.1 hypothetical protein BU14_0259s0022 [Porphyra umbilicalis]